MCLYPKIIKNRKYTANKKNGGVIPAIKDTRVLYVPVKCGKCMECMKQKAREWKIRLQEEVRTNEMKKYFVTMTYNTEELKKLAEGIELEGYDLDNEIARKSIRLFTERWRKKYKKSVRHWLVTELGGGRYEHLHIHGIIITNKEESEIEKIWQYGNVWIGNEVNEKTINYIVKYIHKIDTKHTEYNPKIFASNGIGKSYTERQDAQRNKYNPKGTIETYKFKNGMESSIPIYYRNKIYNEEEKEKLWIEKLNKKERWINGERIDISKGEEIYYKALEYNREKNKRLGYGNDEINWTRKRYERQRRNLIYKERIGKEREHKVKIRPNEINKREVIKGIEPNIKMWDDREPIVNNWEVKRE